MDSNPILPDNYESLLRLLLLAPLAYAGLILILRVSGKRMLSKLNAFDLVVTVALGSTLSSLLLSKDVSLIEGLLALALLIGLQYAVAWTATRLHFVNRMIKSDPSLLFYDGEFVQAMMRRENVSRDAVVAGIRQQGFGSLDEVAAVVLESDGSLSAIRSSRGQMDALSRVKGFENRAR